MTDVLDQLLAADPATGHAPDPPASLLAAIVAEPRRTRRRRRPRLLAATAIAALAATAAVVALPGGGNSLLARAYAQTTPGAAVVHSIETDWSRVNGVESTTRVERWVRGDDAHVVLTRYVDGKSQVYDQVVGADGVLHNKLPEGEIQEVREADGGESADIVRNERLDAVAWFRKFYEEGALQDAGPATFRGTAAHMYTRTTDPSPRFGVQTTTERFYLDASSGMPLGIERTMANGTSRWEFTTTIDTFERLDPTPENLAKLRW